MDPIAELRQDLSLFLKTRLPQDVWEDVLQDVLETCLRYPAAADAESQRRLAFVIARRSIVEHWRGASKLAPLPDDLPDDAAGDEETLHQRRLLSVLVRMANWVDDRGDLVLIETGDRWASRISDLVRRAGIRIVDKRAFGSVHAMRCTAFVSGAQLPV